MKKNNQFKVYALDFDNFTRLACKGVTVYVAELQHSSQHFTLFEVVASGKNEVGEIVELVIDCGGGLIYQDIAIQKASEHSRKVFESLKERLSQKGYVIEQGRISDTPVYAKFEGFEGGAK